MDVKGNLIQNGIIEMANGNKKKKLIFVRSITRNGKVYYASDYGKKAFPIWVDE